jgi:hypothetical protein
MVSSGLVVRPVLEGWSLRVWGSLGYLWGFRSEDVLDVVFCSVALLVWLIIPVYHLPHNKDVQIKHSFPHF